MFSLSSVVLRIMPLLVGALLSSGCTVTTKFWPPIERQIITATAGVNPDINRRPSPVQVKVFQLSERTTFDNLTFDQIFYQGQVLLSDTLLSESSFVLQPREQIKHIEALNENVAYIAIVAAYRNIEHVRWKHVYSVKSHGHGTTNVKFDAKGIAEVSSDYSKHFKTEQIEKQKAKDREKAKAENPTVALPEKAPLSPLEAVDAEAIPPKSMPMSPSLPRRRGARLLAPRSSASD